MAEQVISWFEIPAADFDRAVKFYKKVLGHELQVVEMGPAKMGMFPAEPPSTGGAVVRAEGYSPGDRGTMVYFYVGDDLSDALKRVEPAGGKVVVPKTLISEDHGYFAVFKDTEGNKVGLHSRH
ncbi:MAG: glyoxalase [Candidatus Glassbacteria bacterium RIFCSPLOWO2_12_FULL_58_11]|uniref:Glyoxalase n=1 Tax=Candidatus Glassbacteria bacterium RIFCSPLOWO2_12_FULL_58_11 TaxID=1817867 RepID=A0A1F5YZ19_9BACT|nr:MAG: glyoxalase [Candidatus Glassbacteria bacterium RIFCSPLOWO2_12_FULL_58_11]